MRARWKQILKAAPPYIHHSVSVQSNWGITLSPLISQFNLANEAARADSHIMPGHITLQKVALNTIYSKKFESDIYSCLLPATSASGVHFSALLSGDGRRRAECRNAI